MDKEINECEDDKDNLLNDLKLYDLTENFVGILNGKIRLLGYN